MGTIDPFDRFLDPDMDVGLRRAAFPVVLCGVSILFTSLGLVAAAVNVRWGAAVPPDRTEALDSAWVYVHALLALMWLVVWPAVMFRRGRRARETGREMRAEILWDLAALAIGAIPAVGSAAFLATVTGSMAAVMLALQGSLAILTCGTLALAAAHPLRRAIAAGTLASVALAGPLIVYFFAEFFPIAPDAWYPLAPLMAVSHAARPEVPPSVTYWVLVALCAVLGVGLFALSFRSPRDAKP